MSLSRGADFISRLDLPHDVKLALGPSGAVALGEWFVAHGPETVDVLVEAGVMGAAVFTMSCNCSPEPCRGHPSPPSGVYRVVRPHKHEWRVDRGATRNGDVLVIRCECEKEYIVPNRLPIEVPE